MTSNTSSNIEAEIQDVKKLLGQSLLKPALDKLKKIISHIPNKSSQKKLENQQSLLSAQYHDNEQSFHTNLINYQEYSQVKAKTHSAAILLCDDCLQLAFGNSKSSTKHQIVIITTIGCSLLVILFFVFLDKFQDNKSNQKTTINLPLADTIKVNNITSPSQKDTCQEQKTKLRVDIAYFEATGSQPFANRLKNDVKDHIQLPENIIKVDLYKTYLPTKKQLTSSTCGYRGLMVYGTRSTTSGNQSLTCTIDIINVKKVEASHRLEEPSHVDFKIDKHSEYISYFISGLLKFYLGLNNKATDDFKTFLSKVKSEKHLLKKK